MDRIQAFRIQNLETRLGLYSFTWRSLELECEFAQTDEEKRTLSDKLSEATEGFYLLLYTLDLLRRLEETEQVKKVEEVNEGKKVKRVAGVQRASAKVA